MKQYKECFWLFTSMSFMSFMVEKAVSFFNHGKARPMCPINRPFFLVLVLCCLSVNIPAHAVSSSPAQSGTFTIDNRPQTGQAGLSNIFAINNADVHIAFSNISNQQSGQAYSFNITLTAKKSTGEVVPAFYGSVQLYVSGGPRLSCSSVTLQNGTWTGSVWLDSPAHTVKVSASASSGNITGASNTFSVTSAIGGYGKITGLCVDSGGDPVVGVPITINLSKNGSLVATTTSNTSTGRYNFSNVAAGVYTIEAEGASICTIYWNHQVVANQTTTRNMTIQQSDKPAVIFVPGIMGSTTGGETMNGSVTEILDDLEIYNPSYTVLGVGVKDPVGWKKLAKALKNDYIVIEAPWDWRREIDQTTFDWYLRPKIDEAQRLTARKVNIVAHSAGGLLVRYYIQSNGYQNDIDKFAMLGTPNGGAAPDAYYLWEGADIENIKRIDTIVSTKESFLRNILEFANDGKLLWSNSAGLDYGFRYHDTQENIQKLIHKTLPGMHHFMLVSGPLLARKMSNGDYTFEYYDLDNSQNLITRELNDDTFGKDRLVPGNTSEANLAVDQVRTRLFITASEDTTCGIVVSNSDFSRDLYPLGTPIATLFEDEGDGDGTVLWDSAIFGLDTTNFDYMPNAKEGDHVELPKLYTEEIVSFFKESSASTPTPAQTAISPFPADDEPMDISVLTIQMNGRVQPLLTAPNGQRMGIMTDTGDLVEELAGEISVKSDFSSISVANPGNGSYQLDFAANPGEVDNLAFIFADGQSGVTVERRWLAGSGVHHLEFSLDTGNESPLRILDPAPVITGLTTAPVDGFTLLQWGDPNGLPVAGYRIYGRPDGYRLFELLGESSVSEFQTSHPWMEEDSPDLWSYIVVSVADDGRQSFFDAIAENYERLMARFDTDIRSGLAPITVKFTDRSTGYPAAWEWDFDADGVVDSTEQNPTWIYNQRGSQSVVLKVILGNKSDTTVRSGLITVGQYLMGKTVDIQDLLYMVEVWLTADKRADIAPQGGDGKVNILDYAELAKVWLQLILPPEEVLQ